MNNSEENVGIFDALLPKDSQEQPIEEGAVETDDVTESVDVEANADTDSVEVEEESSESDQSEELFFDLDGEEVSVSQIKEWKQNGMLQSDYTKKRQVDAEKAKEVEAKSAQLDEALESYKGKISEVEKILAETQESIDWDYLRDNDPSEYLKQKELDDKRVKVAEKAKEELKTLQEQDFNNRVANEQKALLEALPEWADEEVMKADMTLINDYFEANNFSDEDMSDLVNHKAYVAFLKAAKYDAFSDKSLKTEKAVNSAPKKVVKASSKTKQKAGKGTIANPHGELANALYG